MTKRPIYYDTETTGISHERDFIIEIAAFDPIRERTFVSFINPGTPIPKEATAIHGITDEMVKEAPSFAEVGKKFFDFCQDGETVLIAHNNDNFDLHFLRKECKRNALDFPELPMIDSLKWARKYRPDLPRHSLQYLREVYGIKENQAHRALDDVMILAEIFSIMIDDLPLNLVLDLIYKKNELIKEMPFGKHQGVPLEKVPQDYVLWLEKSGAFEKPENCRLKDGFQKLGVLKT